MAPSILISIVNWNGKDLLEQCLSSLYSVTEGEDFDVIVVDNGSEDGSVAFLKDTYPEVFRLENAENRGFAKAHNQAIRWGLKRDYDYVLLLNNDVELVEPRWLKTLVEMMERDETLGVGGCRIQEPDGSVYYDGRYFPLSSIMFPVLKQRYKYNRIEQETDEEHTYVDDVAGTLFMIRLSIIEDVGLLDEAYSPAYYEESDYCMRVWNSGYRVGFTNQTTIVHARHETSAKLDSVWLEYHIHRNRLRFILTNYPLLWILIALPVLLIRTLEIGLDVSGNRPQVKEGALQHPLRTLIYLIKPYTETIKNAGDIVEKRKERRNAKELLK